MKRMNTVVALLALTVMGVYGQATKSDAGKTSGKPDQNGGADYRVTERGPHHRVWQKTVYEPRPSGELYPRVVEYIELATGLHYQNAKGMWMESKEVFELLPGKAVARQGQHKISLNYNLNSAGAVEMETPDGKMLKSHVLGLSYYDSSTGQSVLIAEVKDSAGKVTGNQVVYEDAFTDFKADVRYTYTKAGFEQDIILREQPPGPEAYGLNPKTTRLQVLTEFLDPPEPSKTVRLSGRNGAEVLDEDLSFGIMRMARGKAFSVSESAKGGRAALGALARPGMGSRSVSKQWLKLEDRHFLVEEVPVMDVVEELKRLPAAASALVKPRVGSVRHVVSAKRVLPGIKLANTTDRSMELALYAPSGAGLVLDYVAINPELSDFTFRAGTTYLVNDYCWLSGTTTIEGGAVIKYSTNSVSDLCVDGSGILDCQTASYCPAVFTSINDDSVGETIIGSTGVPSIHEYGFLEIYGPGSNLRHVRISYAYFAMCTYVPVDVSDVQIVHGDYGVVVGETDSCTVRNVLMHDLRSAAFYLSEATVGVEHLTVNQCPLLLYGAGGALYLTNSLLVNITSNPEGTFTGINNSNLWDQPGSAVFQTVGGGQHYLADNSPYRNAGTTNINAGLLAELRKKTTFPPVIMTNDFTTDSTLSPVAGRDTDDLDLGYHYDPLDYWTSCTVSNATLTLTNGVVIGYYQDWGIRLESAGKLVSQGTAKSRNHLAYFGLVQEQPVVFDPNGLWNALPINPHHSDISSLPELSMRFTTMNVPTGAGAAVVCYNEDGWDFRRFELHDCELFGGGSYFYFYGAASNASYRLENNLFANTACWITTAADSTANLVARNNLFRNAPDFSEIVNSDSATWEIKDNVFDRTEVWLYGDMSHNAYVNGTIVYHVIQPTDIVLNNFNWVAGPLGNFYQLTTDLMNKGSQTADQSGLYHYTTRIDQVKETNSVVDIGYHYVAVDASDNPVDTDGDSIPDWREDANGNGSADVGETDWTDFYNGVLPALIKISGDNQSGRLNAFLLQPLTVRVVDQGGTPLISAPITFSVATGLNQLGEETNGLVFESLSLRTDGNGDAAAWLFLPLDAPASTAVTVAAQSGGSAVQVAFAASAESVATPVINPNGGKFATLQDVTVSCATAGATMHYTLDNNEPTEADPVVVSGVVRVLGSSTLKVKAFKSGELLPSLVATVDFTITGAIAAGSNHTLALKYDGSAWAAGTNRSGQLGDGTWVNRSNFVSVSNLTSGVIALAGGGNHSLALLSNGVVKAWGTNNNGQLGNNTTTSRNTNVTVLGLTNVSAIAVGGQHSLALSNGWVRAWGTNGAGQLGDGTTIRRLTNVLVTGLSNVVGIAAGGNHSLALLSNQTVRAWGANNCGQLGDNTTTIRKTYVTVLGLTNVSAIAAGGQHSLALSNGWVRAWGTNANGQLGDGTTTRRLTNVLVVGLSNVTAIAAGESHSLALLSNGTVRAWGLNTSGQLGDGTTNSQRTTNVIVAGLSNVVAIAAGRAHSVALKSDGTVVLWGYTNYGLPGGFSRTPVTREPNFHLNYWAGPSIVTQPQSQAVVMGQIATFRVTTIGTMPMSYQWYSNNTAIAGATGAILMIPNVQPDAAANYYVVVNNTAGSVTSATATLTVLVPVTIATQPVSQTACSGTTAIFSVTASGTAPFSYQWKHNGAVIAGATGAMLTLANVQLSDAGEYTVGVGNCINAVESRAAALTVWVPPTIVMQPTGRTIIIGETVSISVVASGTAPLTYQWMKDGVAIAGATDMTLNRVNVQEADTGIYTVVVSNSCGSVESSPATLVMPVTILTQPQSQTISSGGMVSFSVAVSGTAPLNYQWKHDGEDIAGATNSTLAINNAQGTDGGVYQVVVSNPSGSVESAPCTLAVESGSKYYVSTAGSDSNPGTSLEQPFRTVQKAFVTMVAGDSVYIRGGTYRETVDAKTNHLGCATNRILVSAYSNEVVVIKGSEKILNSWERVSGHTNIWKINWATNSQQVFVHDHPNFDDTDDGYPLQQVGMPNERYFPLVTNCNGGFNTNYFWSIWPLLPVNMDTATIVTNITWDITINNNTTNCTPTTNIVALTSVEQALAYMDNHEGTFFSGGFSEGIYVGTNLFVRLRNDVNPNERGIEASTQSQIFSCATNAAYLHVKNLRFRHSNYTKGLYWPVVRFGDGSIVENCDIQWVDFQGIGAGRSWVIKCNLSNNGCMGGTAMHFYGCTFTNNNYRNFDGTWGCAGVGKYIPGAPYPIVVEHCTVVNNNCPGIWFDWCNSGELITVRNNYVANNTAGIFVEVSTNALVCNNLVLSNITGICVASSRNVKVYNNVVVGTLGPDHNYAAIAVANEERDGESLINNEVRNNIIWNTVAASDLMLQTNSIPARNIYVYNNVSDYNCFYRPNTAGLIICNTYNSPGYSSLDAWTNATGFDVHSLYCDPQFVDPEHGDFRLRSTSPLIDRGQPLLDVLHDYRHSSRPQGAGYDIGAFER